MIIDRMDYKTAMIGFLVGPESYYEKRSVNAMSTAHRNIIYKVGSIGEILSAARNEVRAVIQKILPLNPGAAKFFCMPKIHKATEINLPFTPIVSSVGILTRGLEGWLAKQLNPLVGTFSSSHIKNNVDFKEKLRNCYLGNKTGDFMTLSLDVRSFCSRRFPLTMS